MKVTKIEVDSNELTVENGLKGKELSWLDFELDSAYMELTYGSLGGRQSD